MGIPVVRALRDALPLSRVWPFETGLGVPSPGDARVVLAEVYPSLLRVNVPDSAVRDAVQVESVAREFARLDASGALAILLAGPRVSARARHRVVREECWILGVT
jgi:precorrin-8X/cobalt-precorrin-8 methylmutase